MIENLLAANNAFQAGKVYLAEYQRVLTFKLRRPKREKFLREAASREFSRAYSAMDCHDNSKH